MGQWSNKGQVLQYNKGYAILATWPDHLLMRSLNVRTRSQKDKAMYEAHLKYGYTLKEIAEYIGIHYTTESKAIKKIEREEEKWYCKTWPLNIITIKYILEGHLYKGIIRYKDNKVKDKKLILILWILVRGKDVKKN